MTRPFRAALLVLVLLLESLGSAWALPMALPAPQQHEHGQAQAAMPCHGDAGTQDPMPCCDDDEECRCSVSCYGASSALAPALAGVADYPSFHPQATGLPPAPLPAHPLALLRPPAPSES
ncbi:hypothetical protein D0B54_16670 [Solimonas sp. K1W22B-7]|uniref:hypothetical protein n=1 Tax=Solimonas sp. K1W22B-7 TaxID=2303331 RepID=UPI000E336D19|nr:hypothetical protein [Solimonas sp. K1W22B-7]AXQ30208.1 hypothetical protein D0B54_16670 [Solimonas sp. K1W22B-7]